MTHAEIDAVVSAVLDQVDFAAPVSVEDVTAVRDAILVSIPSGIEVYHLNTRVMIRVFEGTRCTYIRTVNVTS